MFTVPSSGKHKRCDGQKESSLSSLYGDEQAHVLILIMYRFLISPNLKHRYL